MRYLYHDLGQQQQGSQVVAHLRGSAANVILLDPLNFDRYRFGKPFLYRGGFCRQSPAELQIPEDGHWYLVVDCGGYIHRARVERIEISTPDAPAPDTEADTTLVGATAA